MEAKDLPLLVIGAGRGGTSILAACLDGHPRIVMRSEYRSAGLLMGDSFPIAATASLIDDRLTAFRAACDDEVLKHPGRVWGNKITTEQIGGLEEHNALNDARVDVVERFVGAMTGYRIVFILRHGASCVDSKVRRTGQPPVRAAIKWCYAARLFERLRAARALAFWCRYENLVSDPKRVLAELCDCLGLPYDAAMLSQTDNGDLLLPEYRHGRFLAEKATEIPSLSPELGALLRPWLERLGYA
ncbi:sulfotransferase family protein [Roseiarcus fermentans]|uniref:Sulfotransferase family protein n=1 Tax=Roseiarcus fermentans TaxID=1473586 RepID=A0A366ESZ3_9HYPH|nr:sulfotransferase [Roseiarcus fermentans]RBP04639.1 sulfotransferase family protein [Roseiarcus fermentans]